MEKECLKAPVGGIQKFSTEDGPGIRTTVFLKGCPLNCSWCHNPELIAYEQQIIQMPNSCIGCGHCISICPESAVSAGENGRILIDRQRCSMCMACVSECYAGAIKTVADYMTAAQVMYEVEQDKGFYDNTGGGMTISGGEVLSHGAFAENLVDEAAKRGINVCIDTSGCGDGNQLMKLAERKNVTDILYDMKSLDDDIHMKYTGRSNEVIVRNLIMLAENSIIREKVTMRMPLISGVNDSRKLMEDTSEFYKKYGLKKLTLLPYHDLGLSKKRNIGQKGERFEAPDDKRLDEIKKLFEEKSDMYVEILGKI